MKMRKNSFFAFCFSIIPGAAHMYMGFMKLGISFMVLLTLDILIAIMLNAPIILVFLPILWFYSFFDAHHKRALPEEEFQSLDDNYLFNNITGDEIGKLFRGNLRPIIAGVFIFLGTYMLYQTFLDFIRPMLNRRWLYEIYRMFYDLPKIVIALFIILVGMKLIGGKKRELDLEENNNAITATEIKVEDINEEN